MVRVLSGLVLLLVVLVAIWFFTPIQLLVLVEAVVVLTFLEYAALAEGVGVPLPRVAAGAAVMASCAVFAWPAAPVEVPIMVAGLALAALALGSRRDAVVPLSQAAAGVFGTIYIGLPLGSLVGVRILAGREAVLLLLLTVIASDTGQYYTGRLLGRHLLSPVISPKKTVEGAAGGFVAGTAVMALAGRYWLPGVPPWLLPWLGVAIVALGIAGDLFESLLKRTAGVKDSSTLIPGHGGMLDRIDALLFAAPAYYIVLRYGIEVASAPAG